MNSEGQHRSHCLLRRVGRMATSNAATMCTLELLPSAIYENPGSGDVGVDGGTLEASEDQHHDDAVGH